MNIEIKLNELLLWAKERKSLETDNRPDINIHKKNLIITWNQIIRKLEEEISKL